MFSPIRPFSRLARSPGHQHIWKNKLWQNIWELSRDTVDRGIRVHDSLMPMCFAARCPSWMGYSCKRNPKPAEALRIPRYSILYVYMRTNFGCSIYGKGSFCLSHFSYIFFLIFTTHQRVFEAAIVSPWLFLLKIIVGTHSGTSSFSFHYNPEEPTRTPRHSRETRSFSCSASSVYSHRYVICSRVKKSPSSDGL